MSFDIQPGGPASGSFTATIVPGPGPNVAPLDMLRDSDVLNIKCDWYITGPWASSLGGNWYLQADFESIGGGPEFSTTPITVPLNGSTGPGSYTRTITIPAGALFPGGNPKVPAGHRTGAYAVTVQLAYTDMAGSPGPMAASFDLGKVTFYL